MKKFLVLVAFTFATFISANAQANCEAPCAPIRPYCAPQGPCCDPSFCNDNFCGCSDTYVSLFLGANFLDNHRKYGSNVKFDTGFAGAVAIGKRFESCWGCDLPFRGELEFSYRYNKVRHTNNRDYDYTYYDPDLYYSYFVERSYFSGSLKSRGHATTYAVMANAYYDFSLDACFSPYIGVGIGYAHSRLHLKVDDYYISNLGFSQNANSCHDDFAWQVLAGIKKRIFESTDLAVEYRYFNTSHLSNNHSIGVTASYNF